MALYFLDASALVKYYVREPGATWVRDLIDARAGDTGGPVHLVFVADISVAEVAAAFAVLHRTGRIGRRVWDGAFERFMADVATRFHLAPATHTDFFEAAALTRRHPLKAYDAVQLGVALRLDRAVVSLGGLVVTFVSGDVALVRAAVAEGLSVDNPFDHVLPEDTRATDVRGTA
jgi:predicted nucleic acid-binding protein